LLYSSSRKRFIVTRKRGVGQQVAGRLPDELMSDHAPQEVVEPDVGSRALSRISSSFRMIGTGADGPGVHVEPPVRAQPGAGYGQLDSSVSCYKRRLSA
jgi:hypothetical protein